MALLRFCRWREFNHRHAAPDLLNGGSEIADASSCLSALGHRRLGPLARPGQGHRIEIDRVAEQERASIADGRRVGYRAADDFDVRHVGWQEASKAARPIPFAGAPTT